MTEIPENVYPGHALITALHVFKEFKSASQALAKAGDYPCLVSSSKIPGSGDTVWACYNMIKHIQEKSLTPETALLWADGQWVGLTGPGTKNFEDRFKDGLKVACEARSLFLQMAKSWDWT